MDKVGGGSKGLAVGPRRGKDKGSYPGPQAEVENDEDH
jgi:hypothetical protein